MDSQNSSPKSGVDTYLFVIFLTCHGFPPFDKERSPTYLVRPYRESRERGRRQTEEGGGGAVGSGTVQLWEAEKTKQKTGGGGEWGEGEGGGGGGGGGYDGTPLWTAGAEVRPRCPLDGA